MKKQKNILISYIPVLHDGYWKLFQQSPRASTLYIVGENIIRDFPELRKDIRRLDPHLIQRAIIGWDLFQNVEILHELTAHHIRKTRPCITMTQDDLSTEIAKKYFPDFSITYQSTFLRWDKKRSMALKDIHYDTRM
ncbi:MAG: hypothetical protein AAB482_00740, partial [Patescibacteria group bacterium]